MKKLAILVVLFLFVFCLDVSVFAASKAKVLAGNQIKRVYTNEGWQLFQVTSKGKEQLTFFISEVSSSSNPKQYGVREQIWYSPDKQFLLFEVTLNINRSAILGEKRALYLMDVASGSYYRIYTKETDIKKSASPKWIGKNVFTYKYHWLGCHAEGFDGDLEEKITIFRSPDSFIEANPISTEVKLMKIALAYSSTLARQDEQTLAKVFEAKSFSSSDFYAWASPAGKSDPNYIDPAMVIRVHGELLNKPDLILVAVSAKGIYSNSRAIVANTRQPEFAIDVRIDAGKVKYAFIYSESYLVRIVTRLKDAMIKKDIRAVETILKDIDDDGSGAKSQIIDLVKGAIKVKGKSDPNFYSIEKMGKVFHFSYSFPDNTSCWGELHFEISSTNTNTGTGSILIKMHLDTLENE